MPRRHRHAPDAGPARRAAPARRDTWHGTPYEVRSVRGELGRPYRCPGCDQVVTGGTPHVVAWPVEDLDAADRRHWHAACWSARDHRAPTRRWS